MRKLILFLLVFVSVKVSAQVYQEMPQYGYRANRMAFDSTLQIPTVCGVPTLKSIVKTNKSGAIAYDSCNARFYAYNPKTLTWMAITSGSADTTSLSNRINLKIDSLKRSNDSIYAYRNGTRVFQFKDSVGGGGDFWKTSGITNLGGDVIISSNNGNLKFVGGDEDELNTFFVIADSIYFKTIDHKFYIDGLITTTDTSTYKPLGIDNNTGRIAPLTSWVSSGTSIDTTNQFVKRLTRTPGKDSIIYFVGANRFAIKDSVGSGSGVPYTGATQDVDLGQFKISAQSFQVEGTNGLGHIHFKHQNGDATATGQSTVLYANSNGDLKYKNAGNYYSTLKTQQSSDRVYTFQNKSYTLADSSDLTAKLNISDTSTMLLKYLRKTDTFNLSNKINLKLNITDTSTLQPKSISSYSILANNTSATANAQALPFKDTSGVYTGTITWSNSNPSGATTHTYRWVRIGNMVTLTISLVYATVSAANNSSVTFALPSDAPIPVKPTGLNSGSSYLYPAIGNAGAALSNLAAGVRGGMRNNAANGAFEIVVSFTGSTNIYAQTTVTYFTN